MHIFFKGRYVGAKTEFNGAAEISPEQPSC